MAVVAGTTVALPALSAAPASAASDSAWDKIAECESSGRWNLPYGHADSTGGLQIQKRTWDDFDGPALTGAAYPYQATKAQQIRVAELILAKQGPKAWTCDAKVGYPLAAEAGATPSRPQPRPAKPTPSAKPAPAQASKTYEVAAGDTLYSIALEQLGNAAQGNWQPIYDANRTLIGPDPDLIRPGQRLRIPGNLGASPEAPGSDRARESVGAEAGRAPAPTAPSTSYRAPVDAPVNQSFRNPSAGYTLGYHTGTDFAAPAGTPVRAAAAGTVVADDTSPSYGTNVQIKHDNGKYTLYAHLSGKTVQPGTRVAAGELIGYVGSTGNSSGPHLHMEGRTAPSFGEGNFFDVVSWLRGNGVRI
ncbi:peptidoglycan DD-metalloendopeptidase family protein [Streptomyces sp. NPDC048270]|uniref:M23 family metallopeptidase n=1 Tax=Streptomyces sp. NPDC048270 TaxID=3154615 RepID=UPI0034044EEF